MQALRKMVFLTLWLFLPGCMPMDTGNTYQEEYLIVDNSHSLVVQADAALNHAKQAARDFALKYSSGAKWKMIFFAPAGEAYCYRIVAQHTLQISPPAWKSRQSQVKEMVVKVERAFAENPRVGSTPLLEVIDFVNEVLTQSGTGKWHLVVISDLLQSSKELTLTRAYLKARSDSEILEEMAKVCPRPNSPPVNIKIYWYPGLVNKKQAVHLKDHERLRRIFNQFFKSWSQKQFPVTFTAIDG